MTSAAPEGPILLFDGVCRLCSGTVRFVIRRDPTKRIRFASLQSDIAKQLLAHDPGLASDLNSVVLIDDGEVYTKSDAVLRTVAKLHRLWPAVSVFRIVPRLIRDAVYDWVGRNRYRWFGKRDECWVPDESLSDRFLDV